MARFGASESTEAGARARALRAAGHRVIDFSIGEPDFAVPAHVKAAMHKALDEDDTHYTNTGGTPALIDAVRKKFARENGLNFGADQIVVGSGAKSVMYHAFACTIEDGDEVIVIRPYWISYPNQVRILGGTPIFVDTVAAEGFRLDIKAIESVITARTRWLVLNSPNNPTGAVASQSSLRDLGRMLLQHPHVRVMSDEIYEHLIYDGHSHHSIAAVCPELQSRTLVVNGLSKAYAMTGLRIGYAAGPADLIKAMTKLQSQTTSCPSSLGQAGAVEALNGDQTIVRERNAIMATRRAHLAARLRAIPGLSFLAPEGAMYLFCDCSALIGRRTPTGTTITSEADFVRYLLEEHKLVVVVGSAYGCPGYFRISFATSIETLDEGCDRLGNACASLR